MCSLSVWCFWMENSWTNASTWYSGKLEVKPGVLHFGGVLAWWFVVFIEARTLGRGTQVSSLGTNDGSVMFTSNDSWILNSSIERHIHCSNRLPGHDLNQRIVDSRLAICLSYLIFPRVWECWSIIRLVRSANESVDWGWWRCLMSQKKGYVAAIVVIRNLLHATTI